ncbi:MAG: EscU/YscU/HrcU family type III secretion system export apparatus switch protein [Saccharospirillaceae bacterium]|nr:EscU/YscU/HrcU family type III secretion system export apparatus switch protein [Pseudomonadales bacterium]NRB79746.1 EscU/YscU/HrcU family type III secretion system export apparatus switch protein [Saccharospirillaceae bacterium]
MADEDEDKSEQASEHKLREAKKQGNIPKSIEFNSWIVLVSGLVALLLIGGALLEGLQSLWSFWFSQSANIQINIQSVEYSFARALRFLALIFFPFIIILAIASIIANVMQTGPIFTTFPLKPDIKKINPVTGFKKLFSKKTLFEAVKTLIKFTVIFTTATLILINAIPTFTQLPSMPIESAMTFMFNEFKFTLVILLSAWAVIALIDLIYSRKSYTKKMMMSKHEVKEEHKKREGDPDIRSKRKQIQKELSEQLKSLGNVRQADVIITNPTHYAIALKFDRIKSPAPIIIAIGKNNHALNIKKEGKRHKIKIVENKILAQKIWKLGTLNQNLPPELFAQVANIYIKHKLVK